MIRDKLKKWPLIYSLARNGHIVLSSILNFPIRLKKSVIFKNELKKQITNKLRVWYFCVPVHNNLGDYAQYCCIKDWLSRNLPDRIIVEVPTSPIRYDYAGVLALLKRLINPEDIIVFQSGYTSSNVHPDEGVHRKIVDNFKNKTLFFPQTVRYTSEREAKKTAAIYNRHGDITFLARDKVSYETAKRLFYKADVFLMPDIVTTKIGKRVYDEKRSGIAFCIRHDSEKKYADESVKSVFQDISSENDIWTDTTLDNGEKCSEDLIESKIKQFSQHKLTITDRFHGTILSLAASTPVIVLGTTDHKVTEGAEWFLNSIPDYIKVARDLKEAHTIAKTMLNLNLENISEPYFENAFYKDLIDKLV